MKNDNEFKKKIRKAEKSAHIALFFSFLATILLIIVIYNPSITIFNNNTENIYSEVIDDEDKIENGIHLRTGLIDAEGLMTVVNNCTNCHSAKLVTQNRMNTERWKVTIKWMQETQNLWELGENQEIIVNYLVTNYPVLSKGRRMNLKEVNWYTLKN